jgi:hypothetical protein
MNTTTILPPDPREPSPIVILGMVIVVILCINLLLP